MSRDFSEGKLELPGTWWGGEAHYIDEATIHIGDDEWVHECQREEDNSGCIPSRPETMEQVDQLAKQNDAPANNAAENFITEMFFRCWWNKPEKVADEFNRHGWTIGGEPVTEENVASLCYEFQDSGYGYVEGWRGDEG